MHASRGTSGKSTTMSTGGPKNTMNTYFSSKGLDLSPTKNCNTRSKKISSHSLGSKLPPCESIQQQISPRVLEGILIHFNRKVDPLKNELIAAFFVERGIVLAYHLYKSDNDYFELTERRRQLLFRYYNRGSQFVLLYVNLAKFEHYLPISTVALTKILDSKAVQMTTDKTGSVRKLLSKSKSMTSYLRSSSSQDNRAQTDSTSSTQSSTSDQSPPKQHHSEISCVCSQIESIQVAEPQLQFSVPLSSVFSRTFPRTFIHKCSTDTHKSVIPRSVSHS